MRFAIYPERYFSRFLVRIASLCLFHRHTLKLFRSALFSCTSSEMRRFNLVSPALVKRICVSMPASLTSFGREKLPLLRDPSAHIRGIDGGAEGGGRRLRAGLMFHFQNLCALFLRNNGTCFVAKNPSGQKRLTSQQANAVSARSGRTRMKHPVDAAAYPTP